MGWICFVCSIFGLALSLAGSQPCTSTVCNGGTCTNGTDGNFACGPCPQNKTGRVCLDDALSGPDSIFGFNGSDLAVRCDILTKESYPRVQWEYNGNTIARYFPGSGNFYYETYAFQNKTLTYNHTNIDNVTVSVLIIADRDKEYGNYVCDIDSPSTARRLVPVKQGMRPAGDPKLDSVPSAATVNVEFTVTGSAPIAIPVVTLTLTIQQDSTIEMTNSTSTPSTTRSTQAEAATVTAKFTPRTTSDVYIQLIGNHPSYPSQVDGPIRVVKVTTGEGLHPGAIAGIVIGVLVGLALICGLVAFAVKKDIIRCGKKTVVN